MKHDRIILLTLFSGMFGYLLLRAVFVPFTHDEAATFFHFVHTGRFLPYMSDWSTNNHLLNSLLTWVSYHLLGPSPFAQRLPNLLFIPVFFYFLGQLASSVRSGLLRWTFILIPLLTHHFIDFFSLSRGYGMAMAMLAGGIFFTTRAFTSGRTKDYTLALAFMLLAVSGLLLLVNTFLLTILLLMANILLRDRHNFRKKTANLSIVMLLGIVPALFTIRYLFALQEAGRIDYGGTGGFWTFTVKGLTTLLFGPYGSLANTLVIVFSFLTGALLILSVYRSRPLRSILLNMRTGHLFFFLLAGNILATHAEHIFFGVLYPDARASIPLLLFFSGALVFLLDEANLKRTWQILIVLPLALLPVHFAASVNLRFSESDTHNHNIPASFYTTIAAAHTAGDFPPTVQGYQLRGMRWNFMNFLRKEELSLIHYSNYPSLLGDFQIVVPSEYQAWNDHYFLREQPDGSVLALLERKQKVKKKLIREVDTQGSATSNRPYSGLLDLRVDSLVGASLYVGFKINVHAESKPFHAWLVAEVRDRQEKVVRYEYLPLDWFRTSWKKDDKPFINGILVEDIPAGAGILKCYLWNIHEVPFSPGPCQTTIYRMEEGH